MALVTVQRSPSVSSSPQSSDSGAGGPTDDDEASRTCVKSLSECYFAGKGAALVLPPNERARPSRRVSAAGCDIQQHLQSMFYLLRPEETLKMAVKLESVHPGRTRYLVVVSCTGRQDAEESCLLGIDCNDRATVGLVLRVLADTAITLDGDGGFSVSVCGCQHIFKPVSVQAMCDAKIEVRTDSRRSCIGLSLIKAKRMMAISCAQATTGKTNEALEFEEHESLEILRRLPPGTVLIKQVQSKSSQKNEEIRLLKEENYSEKPRKLSQRIRNKKTIDVRRNPLRSAARKDIGKDEHSGTITRQRLLGTKKRATTVSESTKRSKPTNYMNTRSITRKMYNVGATYQAPARCDEIEWKRWPVHGMHERPVYHPQFGLAVEYNGRLFASFDEEGYRNINPEAQIEIVRVDPRVESLDRRWDIPSPLEYTRQKVATAVIRQQLSPAALYSRSRIPSLHRFGNHQLAIEQSRTNFGLSQHQPQQQQQQQLQLEQTFKLERLHQFENSLQHLGQRVYTEGGDGYQQKFATSRLMLRSKEILRNLRDVTLTHSHTANKSNPSKCLIMPRVNTTPITLPFCGVQAIKSNPKGKLFFVRASDAPKMTTTEKTSTITSVTSSPSFSWTDVNLQNKLDNSEVIAIRTPRTYAGNPEKSCGQSQYLHQVNRRLPSIRLVPEMTDGFRINPVISFKNFEPEDHLSEVLDLSKKETRNSNIKMELDQKQNKQESQVYTTDLVHYFKNFNADESIDLFEDPKNLT